MNRYTHRQRLGREICNFLIIPQGYAKMKQYGFYVRITDKNRSEGALYMYTEKDLVRIAKRENNKKRNYLVVNPLQGKHIPVSPRKALEVFSKLAELLEVYKGERILVIGFAETATAIGAQIAIDIGADYIQTTREEIPHAEYLFFSEEHSHATEQKLVKNDLDKVIDRIDRIIFAEDEVTTGKTIWNLITVLERQYGRKIKFAVASLLNGMQEEAVKLFEERGIGLHYLVKIRHDTYPETADRAVDDGRYYQEDISAAKYTACLDVDGWMDTRRLTDTVKYENACMKRSEEITKRLSLENYKSILVLGTEEFMFPGLYLGRYLEERGYSVKFHATTRSPITVSGNEEYPLQERYALQSMYDDERKIFLYNIGRYDAVIVVTDAQENAPKGRRGELSLLNAVRKKNEVIYFVRFSH